MLPLLASSRNERERQRTGENEEEETQHVRRASRWEPQLRALMGGRTFRWQPPAPGWNDPSRGARVREFTVRLYRTDTTTDIVLYCVHTADCVQHTRHWPKGSGCSSNWLQFKVGWSAPGILQTDYETCAEDCAVTT